MTDIQIKEKIKKGDPEVFEWIYQHYYKGLCTYANRFINDTQNSEEIVQMSLFKLWEKRATIEISNTFVGYLFATVRNNCLNYIKHQQIINKYNETYIQELKINEDLLLSSHENGLSIYIANELEEKIVKVIENLPDSCREIFKMSRFDGLKHQEIAQIKGKTINTVQKQISIALARLRDELINYLPK